MNEQLQLNLDSLTDFLRFGLMAPGEHIFEDLTFSADSDWNRSLVAPHFAGRSDEELIDQLYLSLEKAVAEFVANHPAGAVALSGGADSRLILSILLKNHRAAMRDLYLYCRVHPGLGVEKDRDAMLLNQIAKKIDITLEFEQSKNGITNYLWPQASGTKRILTGLWGGELLGGVLLTEFPSAQVNWNQLKEESPLIRFFKNLEFSDQEFQKRRLAIFQSSLYRTSLSGFYYSFSWLLPCYFERCAYSPFLNKNFLQVLFSEEADRFANYAIYKKILLRHCKDLLFVGMNNQYFIADHRFLEVGGLDSDDFASASVASPEAWTSRKQTLKDYLQTQPKLKFGGYLESILQYADFETMHMAVKDIHGR